MVTPVAGTGAHGLALRSPWYAGVRGGFDRFDPQALGPVLQKYDSTDFVERLLADPSDSLTFDPAEDVWSYPVGIPEAQRGPGRLKFSTHQLVRTDLRKLYQPSHNRFYAVVVELFCDTAGMPRLSPESQVGVSLVVRRRQVTFGVSVEEMRRAARALTTHLLAVQHNRLGPGRLDDDLDELLAADIAAGKVELPEDFATSEQEQAWMVGPGGQARWRSLEAPLPDGVEVHEEELPMWRLPAPPDSCPAATTRSLWFGLVPTGSSAHADTLDDPNEPPPAAPVKRVDKGAPKFDEHAIYQVRCVARRPVPKGHEHCPPHESWSGPTRPFRLATFFDPEGTKNHAVSISTPDFRSLAARAGQPPGSGGVTLTSPPGSQLSFPTDGGIPTSGSVGGTVPKVSTFAIEIFMIVALFLFSLFLPIVMLLFQLWWMLALRLSLPPADAALDLLTTYFGTGKKVSDLPVAGTGSNPDQGTLDTALDMRGAAAKLAASQSSFPQTRSGDFVDVLDPRKASPPASGVPENPVDDPLCPPPPSGTRGTRP